MAAVAVVVAGLLLLGDSSSENSPALESPEVPAGTQGQIEPDEPPESTYENLSFTRDDFDQLSREQQDEMLEDFVFDFWEKELGLLEADTEKESLSLEIFNRPYMQTLTERELFKLSPEDREKAMAEVMENCTQVRKYAFNVVAEAESCMAEKDYANAEAYFVHCLETGRELSVNKEGLIITRLVGIGCERAGLRGLVKLYTQTGDDSKVQIAREELSEIEEEVQEIRRTAKEAEATSVE